MSISILESVHASDAQCFYRFCLLFLLYFHVNFLFITVSIHKTMPKCEKVTVCFFVLFLVMYFIWLYYLFLNKSHPGTCIASHSYPWTKWQHAKKKSNRNKFGGETEKRNTLAPPSNRTYTHRITKSCVFRKWIESSFLEHKLYGTESLPLNRSKKLYILIVLVNNVCFFF